MRSPRSPSSGPSGGLPRPSRRWHEEHDSALNVGPSPSLAVVDAGAVTQFWRKKLLPTAKVRRCWVFRLRAGSPKALRVVVNAVVAPPISSHQLQRNGGGLWSGRGGRASRE